jgi:glycosyltransferase involved in cell wall biosynthesis
LLTREFSVTYTGQLYEGQRDPTLLFEVVRGLIDQNAIAEVDLRIRFYGDIEPWLPLLVARYRLEQVVELNGPKLRKDVMELQRQSQILLLLPWSDPRETGHHSAKLFEYLAAGRPILAVGGSHGVLTQSLAETHAGVHAVSPPEVRAFLLQSYSEFKKSGRVPYSGEAKAIAQYSHPEMARQFAKVLDLTSGSQRGTDVTLPPSVESDDIKDKESSLRAKG